LWEVRTRMVQRLGFQAGTTRVLQVVTDGMKLAPVGPTMIQERNAIIDGAIATGTSADVLDIREGFRVRGMGFSAVVNNAGTGAGNTVVTEAFDVPNAIITNPISISDSTGDNDGFAEPGEPILVSVPITNNSGGAAITNVNGSVTGGGTANFGSIANGATVTRQIAYTVPTGALCGSEHTITITGTSDLGALNPRTFTFRLGAPVGGAPVTFESNTAVTINDNAPATPYSTTVAVSGLTGNKLVTLELTGLTHTFPNDIDALLVGPGGQKFLAVSDSGGGGDVSNLTISFRDAAAALPSDTQWVAGSFRPHNIDTTTDVLPAPAPTAPFENPAPAGTATFTSAFSTNGTALNGTWTLWIRDDVGQDVGTLAEWKLTFEANDFVCNYQPPTAGAKRADFDDDGRSDFSVYRPGANGTWYHQGSSGGFGAVNWGTTGDQLAPGDFDGDGRTDYAVYRPVDAANAPDVHILNSATFTYTGIAWGLTGDVAVFGDYDNDDRTDVAIFRPSTNTWFKRNANDTAQIVTLGSAGDLPLTGDFNGNGNSDFALFRPSNGTWYFADPSNPGTFNAIPFGLNGDRPVHADYNGDGTDDIAVYRNGVWYIRNSGSGTVRVENFGLAADVPVPGDYDGDGSYDIAVYRNGTWFVNRSNGSGVLVGAFGTTGDVAIPNEYLP
jgi:subtilisin-like proprotein convertase family protein